MGALTSWSPKGPAQVCTGDCFTFPRHAVAQLVTALRYKPVGCGFDFRMPQMEFFVHIIFLIPLWSCLSTQPLRETCTMNISWRLKRPERMADNLNPHHVSIALKSGCLILLKPSRPSTRIALLISVT